MTKYILLFSILYYSSIGFSQSLKGSISDEYGISLPNVLVKNYTNKQQVLTDLNGFFELKATTNDSIHIHLQGYLDIYHRLTSSDFQQLLNVKLEIIAKELGTANVVRKRLEHFDVGTMPLIKGVQITTGTNAVIELENLSGAKSSANPREMFAKIPGLNIWESDGAGIQIGIGGRGLSPNRAANFNTRQNGYDISADALGYPESYYTPPFEALKSIEIIRGSASLQFGTQFGGLLNFNIKDAPAVTPLEITTRTTCGNYGYFGTFNRIAGSSNNFFYQLYHQYKQGDGYRENAQFKQHQLYAQVGYYLKENIKVRLEYTHMNYLAQQPGGLTDLQFNKDPRLSYRDRNWFRVDWNMLAFHFDYEISSQSNFNIRAFGMQSGRESLGFLGKISQADPGGNRDMIQGLFKNGGVEARYLKRYKLRKSTTKNYPKGAFLVGGRFYQGKTVSNQGYASASNDADFTFLHPSDLENSSFDFPSKNVAFFTENVFFLSKKLIANFGVRFEKISSSAAGFYKRYSTHPFTFDTLGVYKIHTENTVNRNVFLFGAGLSRKIGVTNSIYVNCTQNYRAINFTDIRVSNPNIIVDSLIKDEYGYTAELGFRGIQKKYLTFDLAAFYVFYGDKIGLAPKKGTIYKERTNIGNAINIGLEGFAEVDLLGLFSDSLKYNLNWFVNAAVIDAHYISSKEANYVGKQVEYVSPFIVKTGLKLKHQKFAVQIQYSYNSEQFSDATNANIPSGDAVIGLVPAYSVIDLSNKYNLNNQVQFELGINNLLNESYFTRRATAYPGPGILPSDGISAYLTFQYKFSVKQK
jgi:Fe(3+) dicitrate transport protein